MQKSYKIIGENLYNLGFGDIFLIFNLPKGIIHGKKRLMN